MYEIPILHERDYYNINPWAELVVCVVICNACCRLPAAWQKSKTRKEIGFHPDPDVKISSNLIGNLNKILKTRYE